MLPAQPGQGECTAIRATPAENAPSIAGYTPAQLRSAYGLATAAGKAGGGAVIAVVTAYSDPSIASDLAAYRSNFKLRACPVGSCLKIVNEHGAASPLPAPKSTWALSDATALDAISALCPKCDLLLVEAASNNYTDLGPAEDTAAASGAKYVLNAWNAQETDGQDSFDHYFNHPGIAIVAPSGGLLSYERTFPGDLPYVTSVGGTTLDPTKFSTRHWAEIAWSKAGSGCSALETKPSWQRSDTSESTGCPHRTQNDVSADADPATGAAVYDSYKTKLAWAQTGGTVLAAAIVTAAYALAGVPAPDTYPASYPYQHSGHLNDVIYGTNGPCQLSPDYICNAGKGFDGPAGLGTPNGTAAFSATGTDPVTLADPGAQAFQAGTSTSIQITGLDSRPGAKLTFTATGLPTGLTVAAVPGTLNAQITGTLPASVHTYTVTVLATDASTNRTGTTKFSLVATGSLAPASTVMNSIRTDFGPPDNDASQCLDAGAETAGTTVTDQLCNETLQQNDWSFVANPGPASGGTLQIDSLCLALVGGDLQLAACDPSSSTQAWFSTYNSGLENLSTGTCLDAGDFSGPLKLSACDFKQGSQQWFVQSTLQSAVPGTCFGTVDQFVQPPTDVDTETCGQSGVDFDFYRNGPNLRLGLGCVTFAFQGYIQTEQNSFIDCQGGLNDSWDPQPDGELLNNGNGLCLSDPGNSALPGNQLQLATCDGALNEIWTIG